MHTLETQFQFIWNIQKTNSNCEIIMTSTCNNDLCTVICDDEIFKRTAFAFDVYQDRYIVIAGGCDDIWDISLTSAAMYDVKKQSSLALPDLPFDGGCHGVVLNDYFYVVHRYCYDRDPTTDSYYFDLYRICLSRRMEWEHVFKHIETSYLLHILTDGNHIFFIFRNQIISFDPSNHKLSPTIEIPYEIRDYDLCFSVLMDNKIFLLTLENIFIYDIAHQSWSKGSHAKSLNPDAAVVIDRWIVVTERNCSYYTFVYDTHTQQWTRVKMHLSLPDRIGHEYVKVGSHIITVGGINMNDEKFYPMTAIHIKHIIPDREWIMLKPYILLRQLIDDNRAAPIIATKKPNNDDSTMSTDTNTKANTNAVVEKLFTNMPLEVFRYILMYL